MLVLVHMPANPQCLCPKCVVQSDIDAEIQACVEAANANIDDFVQIQDDDEEDDDKNKSPTNVPPVSVCTPPVHPVVGGGNFTSPPRCASNKSKQFPTNNNAMVITPPRASNPFPLPSPSTSAGVAGTAAIASSVHHHHEVIGGLFCPTVFGPNTSASTVVNICHQLLPSTRALNFVKASHHGVMQNNNPIAEDHQFANSAVDEMAAIGMDIEGIVKNTSEIFSNVVKTCLLNPMQQIGVYELSNASQFCPMDDTQPGHRDIDKNHKGCFFFTPFMIKNKTISLLNPQNKLEFFNMNGKKVYNKNFWPAALNIKRSREGGLFKTLECAAFIPPWTISDHFKHQHEKGMEWMAQHSAAFPNKSMKQEYATVFLRSMESELVAKARLAGFQTLFLLKNAIIQDTTHFGLHGHQITTINISPKSYLAMVGFYKGYGDDLQLITLQNKEQNFLVLANSNNS